MDHLPQLLLIRCFHRIRIGLPVPIDPRQPIRLAGIRPEISSNAEIVVRILTGLQVFILRDGDHRFPHPLVRLLYDLRRYRLRFGRKVGIFLSLIGGPQLAQSTILHQKKFFSRLKVQAEPPHTQKANEPKQRLLPVFLVRRLPAYGCLF